MVWCTEEGVAAHTNVTQSSAHRPNNTAISPTGGIQVFPLFSMYRLTRAPFEFPALFDGKVIAFR